MGTSAPGPLFGLAKPKSPIAVTIRTVTGSGPDADTPDSSDILARRLWLPPAAASARCVERNRGFGRIVQAPAARPPSDLTLRPAPDTLCIASQRYVTK